MTKVVNNISYMVKKAYYYFLIKKKECKLETPEWVFVGDWGGLNQESLDEIYMVCGLDQIK